MQPIAAQHLLEVLPEGTVLDPFVGGGTTLVEAIRTGRKPIGADASPLALFATAHHTLMASDAKLDALRAQATEAMWYVDPGYKPPRELPLKRNPRTRKAKDAAPSRSSSESMSPFSSAMATALCDVQSASK